MNRRDFLHPGRLASSAGEILSFMDEIPPEEEHDQKDDITLLRFSRSAMATTFEVSMPFGTNGATLAAEAALDEIDRIEETLTVYRESSEVSRLNRLAGGEPVGVAPDLFQLISQCAKLTEETTGAFDITTGALIKAWGFYRRAGRIPSKDELAKVSNRIGMKNVVLDRDQKTVRFLQAGLELNFGSIGKGYALDRAAEILRHYGIRTALLHGGHSSILAVGDFRSQSVSEGSLNRGWPVGIRHPWKPEARLAVARLRNRALGTSAATFQHVEHEGKKLGHILDPRTCRPAEKVASASVLAPTAALADALATAFFILGVDKAGEYCENHPEIEALLLPAGESAEPVLLGTKSSFALMTRVI